MKKVNINCRSEKGAEYNLLISYYLYCLL